MLGKIFSGNKAAYDYLVNSLKTWYTQEELRELILKAGFRKCYFKNIFGGAVAIHIAVK
jgi:ubiquinone/menaquinone biosynthesis C-methylase UbiE